MARWWAPLVALLVVVPATLFAAVLLARPDPLPPQREPIVLQQDTSPSPEPSGKPSPKKGEGQKGDQKPGTTSGGPSKSSVEGAVLDPDDLDDDDDDGGRDDDDWDDDDDDDD